MFAVAGIEEGKGHGRQWTGWIRQLAAFISNSALPRLLVVFDSDDPLYPSNHEARSVSNLLLIADEEKNPIVQRVQKDSHISHFFLLLYLGSTDN